MTNKLFRTRQAPSPTGYLHLGFVRLVILSKIIAKANNGIYAMRLDDTDRNRLKKDAFVQLMQGLEDYCILPDEGVTTEKSGEKDDFYGVYQKGVLKPYIQSQRLKIYHEHGQKMIDRKLAYWSYLDELQRQNLQEIKQKAKGQINWFEESKRQVSESDLYASVDTALNDERKPVMRYRLQRQGLVECCDEILGKLTFNLNLEEDPVFLKSDGFPTYHFAHLVDEVLFENTMVIRGVEWLGTFPMHVQSFKDYWGSKYLPKYLHLPHILPVTGNKKMSKRDGNVNANNYLTDGYLPEAILNYFAFLGWNPGHEKELYLSQEEFINNSNLTYTEIKKNRIDSLFQNLVADYKGLDQLSKSNARFDPKKLDWYNSKFIKMMDIEEFVFRSIELKTRDLPVDENSEEYSYLYLVNLEKNLIYVETKTKTLLGRMHKGQESPLVILREEVNDKTQGKLNLDISKITKLHSIKLSDSEDKLSNSKSKICHIYLYEISDNQVKLLENIESTSQVKEKFNWHNLVDYIENSSTEPYAYWAEMCKVNNLPLFKPNQAMIRQLLAYNLDRNRVNKLSEIGLESTCILSWSPVSLEDLVWKKSDLENSIVAARTVAKYCLNEAYFNNFVKYICEKLELKANSFEEVTKRAYEAKKLSQYHQLATEYLENDVKSWMTESKLDFGLHLWSFRLVLSGKSKSPSPFEILPIIGLEEALRRFKITLDEQISKV